MHAQMHARTGARTHARTDTPARTRCGSEVHCVRQADEGITESPAAAARTALTILHSVRSGGFQPTRCDGQRPACLRATCTCTSTRTHAGTDACARAHSRDPYAHSRVRSGHASAHRRRSLNHRSCSRAGPGSPTQHHYCPMLALGSPRKVPLVTLPPPLSVPGIPRLAWYPFRHGKRGACAAWNRAAWRGVAARDWRGSLAEGKASAKGQGGGARQWQAAYAAAGYKHGPARRLLPMLRELATLRG